ncbi:ATP-grasp enzyme [Ilumatobacter sp.]|uniref:ATP-grasp enzyme n=1 Tax=Ilumatobacter sp. TaxID=1967498 RepID=UPI003B527C48
MTQLALATAAPLTLAITLASAARTRTPQRAAAADARTILISGGKMTKALQLARSFHRAGHDVVLIETARYHRTGHRRSRAVRSFHVVPEPGAPGYVDALAELIERERVDVWVPVCSPAASLHDSVAAESLRDLCEVIHVDVATVTRLDDKHLFARTAEELGLGVPETHLVTDPAQVLAFDFARDDRRGRSYVMKSIAYDPIRRLDLTRLPRDTPTETAEFLATLPISGDNPWILQEFVEGTEYCTHATVRDGRLQLHCCCESSAFQINYAAIDDPEIEDWVRRFVGALGLTGQISLDFIRTPDGELKAIECNPRTHSAITLFRDHPDVASAYLDDGVETVTPLPGARPTHWIAHELWRALSRPSTAPERWRVVRSGVDAIWDREDPWPFFAVHHEQIPSLLLDALRRGRDWVRIDVNIGKLVEPGGD